MTAAEKEKIAGFLDLTRDFLTTGYRSEKKNYNFEDDISSVDKINIPKEEDSLEKIAAEIKNCTNCPLCKTRKNAVPGEGAMQPLVMVIGEGPGADEDAQGRPFVGKAGMLLDKMLAAIELSRNTNCFIANVIKCRPPENRDPRPEETLACASFIERQINFLKPKYILISGRIAAQSLLKTTESIGRLRGIQKDIKTGTSKFPLLVTYHPAALLRNEELKRPAWEDLKLLRSRLEDLNPGTENQDV
jgi:DNA polymerase